MAVLSDLDLKRILTHDDGIIILNKRGKSITGLGYDLTIGFIRDADTGEEPSSFVDEDNYARYTLLSGHRYLVISKEFLYLSSQYMATLHSRGSYALKGIIVSSTTVDPNYVGCITCSLFNRTPNNVHIKKENQFVTMVFHDLRTPTGKHLELNDRGMPMDTLETLHGKFSNINSDACSAADIYCASVWNSIKYQFSEALKRVNSPNIVKKARNEEAQATDTTENPKEDLEKTGIMQITFLVGNGFDLNVGLKTRYKDFYTFYIEQCPEDLLANEISKYLEDWSDLESSLGKYTNKISPEKMDQFRKSEINLEKKLAEYLEKQMELVHFKTPEKRDEIVRKMNYALRDFYRSSQGNNMECIEKSLVESPARKEYTFINFNYTDILDQCLDIASERNHQLHISSYEGKKALHIHGRIHDRDIVLGVNDESQIANVSLRKSDENFSLIKRDINNLIHGNSKFRELQSIIDKSDIICIFGMSFGETDRMWWQSIAAWLDQDSTRKLILFSRRIKSSNVPKENRSNRMDILKLFFDNGAILEPTRSKIDKQIYVVSTEGIFDFKLVKDFEEK